jgi:hypothetical protein
MPNHAMRLHEWGTRRWVVGMGVRSFAGRKRYPTLSDDKAVGKDGAPGFVGIRIFGVVGELLCMLTAFVGDIF